MWWLDQKDGDLDAKAKAGFRPDFFLEAQENLIVKAKKRAFDELRSDLYDLHEQAIQERS